MNCPRTLSSKKKPEFHNLAKAMIAANKEHKNVAEKIVRLEKDLKDKDIKSIAKHVPDLASFGNTIHASAGTVETLYSQVPYVNKLVDRIDRLKKNTYQTDFIQTEKVQEKLTKIQQLNIEKGGDPSNTETVDGETFNSGSATEAKIAPVEEDEPANITQSFKTLSLDTNTIHTTTMTQGTKSSNKPSVFKTVIKAFWPSIPTSKPLATAPKQGKSRGATAKVSKQDMPKEESSMGEGEVNKTEVAQITSDSKVAHPPTRCDNCRTIPCLNNKQIAKQNLVLEKGPFKHGRMYQVSNLKGNLGDTYVTGVVELHPSQPPIFMHYINGNRQTWAEFTEDIKTLKYKCPQRH